ncbi:isopentenyl-diphosphate Delta-isomerase [Plantactinospora endophytica]|uniref:Isopentenyl-diphosphate Delta-isomerase n=1 Tax=Plantactinospora endophytica TaxID=673535 RepID=A0ABQ4EBL6_9ACTN|nr:isopentenyl-diphosphate Delta-isomerase [Plantactinospora endophytica]GIG92126.1 isopentenyl-diphosphate Delta-isomerase [Plantactinospora endophytica]
MQTLSVVEQESTESVVLCGPDGSAAGQMLKRDVHHAETPLHLAFSCYVFDASDRLLVTWRARSKKTWPGVRTNSCCGHPGPGESMRDAVVRRLWQELGVSVQRLDLVLPRFRYRAVMADGMVENELCPVYRAYADSAAMLTINPAEVDSAEWYPWHAYVADAAARPGSISPWSALQVAELVDLGADPASWPVRDDSELPAAAVA